MISIVDYGVGNVTAIANALGRVAVEFEKVTNARDLQNAKKIILPGVGAFDDTMHRLNNSGMRDILDDLVLRKEVPVLGVCVGMQIMTCKSEEGTMEGLGWFEDSTTRKFELPPRFSLPGLPHMGWNSISGGDNTPIMNNINKQSGFYFLHSYRVYCRKEDELLRTDFGGEFTSAIHNRNIFGFQFHPEKSHQNGRQLLKNFSMI